jgi:hypothetical protein
VIQGTDDQAVDPQVDQAAAVISHHPQGDLIVLKSSAAASHQDYQWSIDSAASLHGQMERRSQSAQFQSLAQLDPIGTCLTGGNGGGDGIDADFQQHFWVGAWSRSHEGSGHQKTGSGG